MVGVNPPKHRVLDQLVSVPENVSEVTDVMPGDVSVFCTPILRQMARCLADNLKLPFEGGPDQNCGHHLIERHAVEYGANVRYRAFYMRGSEKGALVSQNTTTWSRSTVHLKLSFKLRRMTKLDSRPSSSSMIP